MKNFATFVKGFGSGKSLLEWVSKYLVSEKLFISKKGGIFRNEVCSLLTLKLKNEDKWRTLRRLIFNTFNENMFKYKEFSPVVKNFMKTLISPVIVQAIEDENITKSDINSECRKKENGPLKTETEAFLLSYLYVFINRDNVEVGAGDIAAEDFFEVKDYFSRQMTSLYNSLTNGSLPSSVFRFPAWFSRLLTKARLDIMQHGSFIPNPLPAGLDLERQRYAAFWKVFNRREPEVTLVCTPPHNCSHLDHYVLVETENGRRIARDFLKDEDKKFRVKQVGLKKPPCHDLQVAEMFGFTEMCAFLRTVSRNKASFLNLMKFTKQAPVFIEEDSLLASLQEKASSHGYFYKENNQRPNSFVALCKFEEDEQFEMSIENCDLFRRSFTNKGLGYTFNNLPASHQFKPSQNIDLQLKSFNFNKGQFPRLITSASPDHALTVLLEANVEEVIKYEKSRSDSNTEGEINLKPKHVLVSLHDPKEGHRMNYIELKMCHVL